MVALNTNEIVFLRKGVDNYSDKKETATGIDCIILERRSFVVNQF
jgi:hypothetical protein